MTYEKHGDMIYLNNGETYVHMNQFNKIGSYLLKQKQQTLDLEEKVIDRNIHIDNLEDTIRKLHTKLEQLQTKLNELQIADLHRKLFRNPHNDNR